MWFKFWTTFEVSESSLWSLASRSFFFLAQTSCSRSHYLSWARTWSVLMMLSLMALFFSLREAILCLVVRIYVLTCSICRSRVYLGEGLRLDFESVVLLAHHAEHKGVVLDLLLPNLREFLRLNVRNNPFTRGLFMRPPSSLTINSFSR